jgi:hypothetical protein
MAAAKVAAQCAVATTAATDHDDVGCLRWSSRCILLNAVVAAQHAAILTSPRRCLLNLCYICNAELGARLCSKGDC